MYPKPCITRQSQTSDTNGKIWNKANPQMNEDQIRENLNKLNMYKPLGPTSAKGAG